MQAARRAVRRARSVSAGAHERRGRPTGLDLLTFFVLLRIFRFDEARFHTGWFVESLATQTLVLFVIRTPGRPWQSRPSTALIMTVVAVVAVGLVLPYTPLSTLLGFERLPTTFYAFLIAVLVSYLALVECVKQRMVGRLLGLRERD